MKTLFLDHIPRSLLIVDVDRVADIIDEGVPTDYIRKIDEASALGTGSSCTRKYKLTERDYDPDWRPVSQLSFRDTMRSRQFLNNKYLLHPVFDYQCYIAGPATLPSIVIFRVEKAHGADLSAMRVLEFIAPSNA